MTSAPKYLFPLICALLVVACGRDQPTAEVPCTDEELWDHVEEECVPRYRDSNPTPDMGESDGDSEPEPDPDMGSDEPDSAPDMPDPVEPGCDADHDGVASIECGGLDCDDTNILVSPGVPELCDAVDNDCDEVNNEGLNCTFYAHSGQTVYAIDPFEKTLTELSTDAPNLQDIDTHPNGTLLGVTFDGLYEFDDIRNTWFFVGEFGRDVQDPNGMAIDSTGAVFVTSQDQIYSVDIIDGTASLLGDLGNSAGGEPYYSSGDCVVNKRDSLYMTSKHDRDEDHLLLVNRDNGSATDVGPIGFTRVFALTSAWGTLYGLTDAGELIEIDTTSGAGTLVHQFPGVRFFGAASTPSR